MGRDVIKAIFSQKLIFATMFSSNDQENDSKPKMIIPKHKDPCPSPKSTSGDECGDFNQQTATLSETKQTNTNNAYDLTHGDFDAPDLKKIAPVTMSEYKDDIVTSIKPDSEQDDDSDSEQNDEPDSEQDTVELIVQDVVLYSKRVLFAIALLFAHLVKIGGNYIRKLSAF